MANDLIIALRRKRMADAADEGSGDGPAQESGSESDMAKYWAMMQDMNSKLDHVLSLLSDDGGKESGPEQPVAKPGMGY